MPNVIDTTKPSSHYIFQHVFFCRIPELQSRSAEHIRYWGVPTTGNKDVDNELKKEMLDTFLPIAKMAEYFKDGVPLYIPKQEDVKFIYECVTYHLHTWRKQIEFGLNLGQAPIDDLILLDEFANSVYSHAKYQFTREIANSLFAQHLSSTTKSNRGTFFKKKVVAEEEPDENGAVTINKKPDLHPPRESLTDLFRDRKAGLRRF